MNPSSQVVETALRQAAAPVVFDDAQDDPLAVAILEAMSDTTSRAILSSIIADGKSIEEIATESQVPISSAYRRVHELRDRGLIMVERIVVTRGGKRHHIYRSAFRGATVQVEPDRVRVQGLPNDGIPDIAFRLWQFAESHRQTG
jgi:DNA-binding transcriptional ArsR family regulator